MTKNRLFRGQPKKYRSYPFIPSALRPNCIKYMEETLRLLKIDVQHYKEKCIPNKILSHYCNCDYKPTRDAFYSYWLSLVNCAISVNNNPICFKFCHSYAFTKNFDTNNVGMYGLPPERIAELAFGYAKDFFDSDKINETYHLQLILHDYAFFQHFNHALSKIDNLHKPPFPTLAMDWTWDKTTAEKFADSNTEKGSVLSISWESYEKWNPTKNFKVYHLSSHEQRIPVFGFESYINTLPWNIYDWYSQDNNLMIEQKGAVIFWPWVYTIDELKENALGKTLDFIEIDR
jgi:hypothetical protein